METYLQQENILQRIVAARRESIAQRKGALPDAALKFAVAKGLPPRNFSAALRKPGINVISELKKASPSLGLIRKDYDPASLASALERAGAAATSLFLEGASRPRLPGEVRA